MDFANMIKDLEMGIILDNLSGPNLVTRILKIGELFLAEVSGRCEYRRRVREICVWL